jgi:hypothetical protein
MLRTIAIALAAMSIGAGVAEAGTVFAADDSPTSRARVLKEDGRA